MADNRRREKARPRIHEEIWCIVNDLIVQDWSPEQVSGWLAVEKNVRINHHTSTSPETKSPYAAGKREQGNGKTASDKLTQVVTYNIFRTYAKRIWMAGDLSCCLK